MPCWTPAQTFTRPEAADFVLAYATCNGPIVAARQRSVLAGVPEFGHVVSLPGMLAPAGSMWRWQRLPRTLASVGAAGRRGEKKASSRPRTGRLLASVPILFWLLSCFGVVTYVVITIC